MKKNLLLTCIICFITNCFVFAQENIKQKPFRAYNITKEFKDFDSISSIQLSYSDTSLLILEKLKRFKYLEAIYFRNVNADKADNFLARITNKDKIDSIYFYNLTDTVIPNNLNKFKNIKFLLFSSSGISSIPKYFLDFEKLEILILGSYDEKNHIMPPSNDLKEFPEFLLDMKSIRLIDISGSQIQNMDYRIFQNKKGIKITWKRRR